MNEWDGIGAEVASLYMTFGGWNNALDFHP